jgi:hypothetical protein
MYKIIIVMLLLLPVATHAEKPQNYTVSQMEVQRICGEYVIGCYLKSYNIIIVSSDLSPKKYWNTYYHELGHYYMRNEKFKNWWEEETYAEGFALWIQGGKLPLKYKKYYEKVYK